MAQHLVLMLVDDEDEDFGDQASLDGFVREVAGGVHQTVSFRAYHNFLNIERTTDVNWFLDSVDSMQREFED